MVRLANLCGRPSTRPELDYTKLPKVSKGEIARLINKALEPFGLYQKFLFVVISAYGSICSMHDTVPTFYTYTPKNFTCTETSDGVSVIGLTNVSSCVPGCTDYSFYDDNNTSIVTDWDLICDKRFMASVSTTIYFVGLTLGSFIFGITADVWGRKKTLLTCLYVQGLLGNAVYFADSWELFVGIRFLQGIFLQGLLMSAFTLLQEIIPAKYLTLTGSVIEEFWTVGILLLGVSAYYVMEWRTLQLLINIPTVVTLLWVFFIPESPKWYLSVNHKDLAMEELPRVTDNKTVDRIYTEFNSIQVRDKRYKEGKTPIRFFDLFRHAILRKHLFVMFVVHFSTSLAYYGYQFFIPHLPGETSEDTDFLIGGVVEAVFYIIGYFLLTSPLGRKRTTTLLHYLNSINCLVLGALKLFPTNDVVYGIIGVGLLGKGLSCSSVLAMFVFTIELFPTVYRGTALGFCCVLARVGSFTAPQLLYLRETVHPGVPMAAISVSLFISASFSILLPETLNQNLPNTLDDVDGVWGWG